MRRWCLRCWGSRRCGSTNCSSSSSGRESVAALLRWVQTESGRGAAAVPGAEGVVVDLFGTSAFVVRIPAALCSIAGAAGFRGSLRPVRNPLARSGRPLCFWRCRCSSAMRWRRAGTRRACCACWCRCCCSCARASGAPLAAAAFYGASVALGLYSQPLTILPVFGALFWLIGERDVNSQTKRADVGRGVARECCRSFRGTCCSARRRRRSGRWRCTSSRGGRSLRCGLLHELSGGGYVCSAALLFAAAVGLAKLRDRRLLACVAAGRAGGARSLVDALVNYFFAARQLLFAAPGAGSVRGGRHRTAATGGGARRAGYAAAAGFLRGGGGERLPPGDRYRKMASERKPACWRTLPAGCVRGGCAAESRALLPGAAARVGA